MVYNGAMQRIIKLVVAVVILYVAYTKGLPWVQGMLENAGSGGLGDSANATEEALCARSAERAIDAFGERVSRFSSPPIDTDAWDDAVSRSRDEMQTAERNCGCAHEACRVASEALDGLDDMIDQFDNSVQGGRGLPPNGARKLESLYGTVNRARSLAR